MALYSAFTTVDPVTKNSIAKSGSNMLSLGSNPVSNATSSGVLSDSLFNSTQDLSSAADSFKFYESPLDSAGAVTPPSNSLFGLSSGQISGLGSLAGSIAGLGSMLAQMPILRAQRRGLEQNIKFAKQDQENRYKNMRSFNSFGQNA